MKRSARKLFSSSLKLPSTTSWKELSVPMLSYLTDGLARVSVLDLLVQMSMRLPEVSRASSLTMSTPAEVSLSKEKAMAIEIARGIPSGTETIRRANAV